MNNSGVISTGDHNQIFNRTVIGPSANIGIPRQQTAAASQRRPGGWDIGVITVISPETSAMLNLLAQTRPYVTHPCDGRLAYEGQLAVDGNHVNAVVMQALGRGQRPAAAAYHQLRRRYAPRITVMVGIAGGIHPDVGLGDVVVGTRIVYYDSRREDPGETRFRGESHDLPPAIQHSVNAFFSQRGEPAFLRRREGRGTVTFKMLPGHIGSGEAVIRDVDNQARRWLHTFNDKILAIETEGSALAHAFHEDRDASAPGDGWLVIRGISDFANSGKDDAYQAIASRNAAHGFAVLLPYLISAEEAIRLRSH